MAQHPGIMTHDGGGGESTILHLTQEGLHFSRSKDILDEKVQALPRWWRALTWEKQGVIA